VHTAYEKLVERGVKQFQKNILRRLHNDSFFNIIFDLPLDLYCACLRSCVRLRVGPWLFACLIIFFFHLASNVFSFAMYNRLGLPPLLVLDLSHYICGQPLDPMGIRLLCCAHGGEKIVSHDLVWDAFASITRIASFHVTCEQTHIFLPPTF